MNICFSFTRGYCHVCYNRYGTTEHLPHEIIGRRDYECLLPASRSPELCHSFSVEMHMLRVRKELRTRLTDLQKWQHIQQPASRADRKMNLAHMQFAREETFKKCVKLTQSVMDL